MRAIIANDVCAPMRHGPSTMGRLCAKCGEDALRPERITTAFWRNGGLVVVKMIPALVCQTCGEEFIDGHTARGLDRMREKGFPAEMAVGRMTVPVFDFRPDTLER